MAFIYEFGKFLITKLLKGPRSNGTRLNHHAHFSLPPKGFTFLIKSNDFSLFFAIWPSKRTFLNVT